MYVLVERTLRLRRHAFAVGVGLTVQADVDPDAAFQAVVPLVPVDDVVVGPSNVITYMRTHNAPTTGLLPDFIVNTNTTTAPAKNKYLESSNDGNYSWNSCRVPWHRGTDYLVSGDSRSKTAALQISNWIKGVTAGDPTKIVGGYTLEGRKKSNGYELSYAAPFGVGATVDVSQQAWVNSIWTNMVGVPIASDHYYGNTLKMQAMLVLSNNYWLP